LKRAEDLRLVTKYLSRLCSIPALFYWSCVFRWTRKFQVHWRVWNFVSQKLTTSLELKYAVFNYYHSDFYKCLNGMFFCIYRPIERFPKEFAEWNRLFLASVISFILRAQCFLNLKVIASFCDFLRLCIEFKYSS